MTQMNITTTDIKEKISNVVQLYKFPNSHDYHTFFYAIENYYVPGMTIIDPFAKNSIIGIIATAIGADYTLYGTNPLTEIIHNAITIGSTELPIPSLKRELKISGRSFIPQWREITRWYPESVLVELSATWGYAHKLVPPYNYIVWLALLFVSKFFSYAMLTPTLQKTWQSKNRVMQLLKTNWKELLHTMFGETLIQNIETIKEYRSAITKECQHRIITGMLPSEMLPEYPNNMLITRLPYYKQNIIIKTKLELAWLGYDNTQIMSLQKKDDLETYSSNIKILSKTYESIKKQNKTIQQPELAYYTTLINELTLVADHTTDYLILLTRAEEKSVLEKKIISIIKEHLEHYGWCCIHILPTKQGNLLIMRKH